MKKNNNTYTNEFKEAIIELVKNSSKSIVELSNELGLSDRTIYQWTYIDRITNNSSGLNLSQEKKLKEELKKIKIELKQSRKEVSILSKILSKKIM